MKGVASSSTLDQLHQRLVVQESMDRRRRLKPSLLSGTDIIDEKGVRRVNFSGNDYLGVVADRLLDDLDDTSSTGPDHGATASSLVCGWSPIHETLADRIAEMEQTESAVVMPSGYAACSGAVAALAAEGDAILSDSLNHASLIDGCRLSAAQTVVVPHRDVNFADDFLNRHRGDYASIWIVTDSVFSMDGTLAPLDDWIGVAQRHDAMLMVDEAHATGVLGRRGSGLCEATENRDAVPIRIGTLSKAIGCQGGFVAGPRVVIDNLIQSCRPLIFSTALSPAVAEAACRIVDGLPGMGTRRSRLASLAQRVRHRLGIPAGSTLESGIPIVPVVTGSDASALRASQVLADAGYFAPAIRPPTVPEGAARVRISISAAHSDDQVDGLIEVLASVLPQSHGV
ncbi:MAG: 8-amino-7-oxononanoate synthase [Planctomycetota bacterium]